MTRTFLFALLAAALSIGTAVAGDGHDHGGDNGHGHDGDRPETEAFYGGEGKPAEDHGDHASDQGAEGDHGHGEDDHHDEGDGHGHDH